jgi:hypothetical protein
MPDDSERFEKHEVIAQINARDSDRLRDFVDRMVADRDSIRPLIAGFVQRSGFAAGDLGPSLGLEPSGLDVDSRGGEAFVQLLSEHPAFTEGRRLPVGLALFGDFDPDPALFVLRRDVSRFLTLAALAFGSSGHPPEDYVDPLIHVALGPEAFSLVLREVLLDKPIPDPGIWPTIPDWLKDLQEIGTRTCLRGVSSALTKFGQAASGSLSTSYATGITLLAPNVGCAGQVVSIQGSGFGASQPSGVDVYFPSRSGGCAKATVRSWSDTAVEVEAPADVGTGCVGFVRGGRGGAELTEASLTLAGELESCIGIAAAGAAHRLRTKMPLGIVSCPPCLPGGANLFRGGPPVIDGFSANGGTQVTVEPNERVTLTWAVRNAVSVWVDRTSSAGPFTPPPVPTPLTGSQDVGVFTGTSPVTARYRLTALGGCGPVTRSVSVDLRARPTLGILGIEVVQAIQRPNNSVSMVEGKRTAVRVYVSSGISNGFDAGFGPNVQPDVTGRLTAFPSGVNQGFDAGPPFNPGATLAAQPGVAINRSNVSHSLNFEVPLNLVAGTVRLDARVWVKGHEMDVGGRYRAFSSATATFLPQATQEVLPILVGDSGLALGPPSLGQFNASLQGARTRYPIAQTGFIVNPPITIGTNPIIGHDLTTGLGWNMLVFSLATWVFLPGVPGTPVGGIRAALVPRDSRYAVNGMGTPRVGLSVPAFAAQNGLPATFAHEMGHCFGSGHAPCPPPGTPGAPGGIDSRLSGTTEADGMDVPLRSVIPIGRGDVMAMVICGDQGRWPTITFWDIVFSRVPI